MSQIQIISKALSLNMSTLFTEIIQKAGGTFLKLFCIFLWVVCKGEGGFFDTLSLYFPHSASSALIYRVAFESFPVLMGKVCALSSVVWLRSFRDRIQTETNVVK